MERRSTCKTAECKNSVDLPGMLCLKCLKLKKSEQWTLLGERREDARQYRRTTGNTSVATGIGWPEITTTKKESDDQPEGNAKKRRRERMEKPPSLERLKQDQEKLNNMPKPKKKIPKYYDEDELPLSQDSDEVAETRDRIKELREKEVQLLSEDGIDGKMKILWKFTVPTDNLREYRKKYCAIMGADSFSTKKDSHIYCAVLFVAFDAGFAPSRVGTLAKDGPRKFELQTSEGIDTLKFGSYDIERKNMSGELENTSKTAYSRTPQGGNPLIADKKQDITPEGSDGIDFYTGIVNDRLEKIGINRYSCVENGLPRVIILSERLQPFPDKIIVMGHKYVRKHHFDITALQDMAGYTLESECDITMESLTGPQNETALKISVKNGDNSLSIAGAHLTSKNTSTSGSGSKAVIDKTKSWMQTEKIDALIGDLNLSSLNEPFGKIPTEESTKMEFLLDEDLDSDGEKKLAPVCKDRMLIETSNGACTKFYMGQLDVSETLTYMPTLHTNGRKCLPPVAKTKIDKNSGSSIWGTPSSGDSVEERTFSDHSSLYCFYVMPGE